MPSRERTQRTRKTSSEQEGGAEEPRFPSRFIPHERFKPFADALRRYRAMNGLRTQGDLAALIDLSSRTVSAWENAVYVPDPWTLFEIEGRLGLDPGQLSVHLGYVPPSANLSTLGAIDRDPRLDEKGKALLKDMYKYVVRQPGAKSTK